MESLDEKIARCIKPLGSDVPQDQRRRACDELDAIGADVAVPHLLDIIVREEPKRRRRRRLVWWFLAASLALSGVRIATIGRSMSLQVIGITCQTIASFLPVLISFGLSRAAALQRSAALALAHFDDVRYIGLLFHALTYVDADTLNRRDHPLLTGLLRLLPCLQTPADGPWLSSSDCREGLCHLFQMERKGAVAELQIAALETLSRVGDDGANGGVRKQIEKLTAVRAETMDERRVAEAVRFFVRNGTTAHPPAGPPLPRVEPGSAQQNKAALLNRRAGP
jgi:hypothetical protein